MSYGPLIRLHAGIILPNRWWVFILSIAVLYFARQMLIPLLALLFTFMLAPVVKRLGAWHFGRVPAVIAVLVVSLAASVTLGLIVMNQMLQVIDELPGYTEKRSQLTSRGPVLSAPASR